MIHKLVNGVHWVYGYAEYTSKLSLAGNRCVEVPGQMPSESNSSRTAYFQNNLLSECYNYCADKSTIVLVAHRKYNCLCAARRVLLAYPTSENNECIPVKCPGNTTSEIKCSYNTNILKICLCPYTGYVFNQSSVKEFRIRVGIVLQNTLLV